jgi:RNA polymerase sigma-70 factor (ECF subfamily)
MGMTAILTQASQEGWTDEDVVERVLNGETPLYEILMRRYNQRLYRIARAILRDDAEAEDVMQDAYVRAYQHLASFEGRAKFATWLTRIAVHEALARSRRRGRVQSLDGAEDSRGDVMSTLESPGPTPERSAYDRELGAVLEKAILQLPEDYRLVFTLREIEEMSTGETAQCLNLTEDNVKVRLHRARALLRKELFAQAGATKAQAFQFRAVRCDRVVNEVFRRIAGL